MKRHPTHKPEILIQEYCENLERVSDMKTELFDGGVEHISGPLYRALQTMRKSQNTTRKTKPRDPNQEPVSELFSDFVNSDNTKEAR